MPSDPSESVEQKGTNDEGSEMMDNEKGAVAATPAAMDEGGSANIDEAEYPTGLGFWAVVVALVLTMLLVSSIIVSLFGMGGADVVAF